MMDAWVLLRVQASCVTSGDITKQTGAFSDLKIQVVLYNYKT